MNVNIFQVKVPQLGVNDEEATIVEWYKTDYEEVSSGEALGSLETAKAVYDVEAQSSGLFVPLCEIGEVVAINQPIGLIGKSQTDLEKARAEFEQKKAGAASGKTAAGDSAKATRKAIELAEKLGVDLGEIKVGRIIKEADVTAHHQKKSAKETIPIEKLTWDKKFKPVVIYGAGRGGVTVKETLESGNEYRAVCFIDDNAVGIGTIEGLPVYGADSFEELKNHGINKLIPAIAEGKIRHDIRKRAETAGMTLINAVHSSSYISPTVKMGVGNHIKAGAVIDTASVIGDCCIIDNGTVVAHDNKIGNACHLAPGVTLGSSISIDDFTVLGIGVAVSTGIRIGRSSIIAVGSSVVKDVPDFSIVEGVPGKVVGQRKRS